MLEALFPIFLFLLLGYVLRRIGRDFSDTLITFCVEVAFPALVIAKLYDMNFHTQDIAWPLIAILSVAIGATAGWITAKALRLDAKSAATFILICSLGNTSFLGFPFISALFGDGALGYAVLFDQFGSFLALVLLGTPLALSVSGGRVKASELAKKVFLFPPFLAMIAGLLLHFVKLPHVALTTLQMLGATLVPLVTIAVGMKMRFGSIKKDLRLTLGALAIKMLLVPLLIFATLTATVTTTAVGAQVSLVESAMPPMVMSVVYAARFGLNVHLAVSAVALGIIASFVIVPFWFTLF